MFLSIKDTSLTPEYANNFPKVQLSSEQDVQAGKQWTYPSDHLPVCGKINTHRLGTFNILNTNFIRHTISNRPGWDSSCMSEDNKQLSADKKLTMREEKIRTIIQSLLIGNNDKAPLDLLCMQECSDKMFEILKEDFKKINNGSFEIILGNGGHDNHVAIIFNASVFAMENCVVVPVFKRFVNSLQKEVLDDWRPIIDLRLREITPCLQSAPHIYRVLTAHISSAGKEDTYKKERLTELFEYVNASVRKMMM